MICVTVCIKRSMKERVGDETDELTAIYHRAWIGVRLSLVSDGQAFTLYPGIRQERGCQKRIIRNRGSFLFL